MKKKIKDLTLLETGSICANNDCECDKCPLFMSIKNGKSYCYRECFAVVSNTKFNSKEVEVEVDGH